MKTIAGTAVISLSLMLASTGCKHTPETGAAIPGSASMELFNGKDLNNWKSVLADASLKKEAVWTVRDGLIVCQGTPVGFIYTGNDFLNFRLGVEYRWPAGSKPGNSGIFSRINDVSKPLPRCIETQLQHGNAGDVLGLQGMPIATNQARFFFVKQHELAGDIYGVKKMRDAEAAPGEWNRVEILAQGSNYTIHVNGTLVNEVQGVSAVAGPVGLQSEGGEIHFRRVTLTPLP